MVRLFVLQRFVDILDVFQGIVEEELDFGNVFQLVAQPLAQGPADEPVLMFETLHHFVALLEGEDADVNLGVAEIGRNTHGRDRDERTAGRSRPLLLEDVGGVLLDLFGDFSADGWFP